MPEFGVHIPKRRKEAAEELEAGAIRFAQRRPRPKHRFALEPFRGLWEVPGARGVEPRRESRSGKCRRSRRVDSWRAS